MGALPGFVQESSGSDDGSAGRLPFKLRGPVRQELKRKRPKASSPATRSKRGVGTKVPTPDAAAADKPPHCISWYDPREDYERCCRLATQMLRARFRIVEALCRGRPDLSPKLAIVAKYATAVGGSRSSSATTRVSSPS